MKSKTKRARAKRRAKRALAKQTLANQVQPAEVQVLDSSSPIRLPRDTEFDGGSAVASPFILPPPPSVLKRDLT